MSRLEEHRCRFCSGNLSDPPLLSYPGSPTSAQGFTDSPRQGDAGFELKIYQCIACGLVQHCHTPVPYYRDVIRSIAFSEEMAVFRLQQLGSWISANNIQDKRILEVGCGKGEFLDLLSKAGSRFVFGIEHSLSNLEAASAKKFQVNRGYLEKNFKNPWPFKFEAFAIFSFLEHWPDLNTSLRQLNLLLTEDAVGLIEVPNFEFIFDKKLYSEFTTDHIFYFNRVTLVRVLEINGFDVQSVDSIWHDYILSAKIKKRKPIDVSGFSQHQKKIVNEIHDFLNPFAPSDVVVWGAGHQSLAVMSLAQLKARISHVIDSADFKQNKYIPGTHLLIKSPKSLSNDNPKAVLIMAAAYSDEVANQMLNEFPQIRHVAILRENGLEVLLNG